ncbi:MAG: asparagine synthetase B, partial [Pyrinomonadaceae bacterium]|nr:asparagine synthetase B [Pyrinomonadaceae bacterium]
MCGIAGFIEQGVLKPTHAWQASASVVLDRMCRIIAHRGPDDQGTMVRDGVALGMRRLSIIDLAGGHQPISGEDGLVTTVFNGEIYNYRELQSDLEARGHRFQTHSDTEAIVHAYEEYGPACVRLFRGMFAFAVWDERARKLFLGRDRV